MLSNIQLIVMTRAVKIQLQDPEANIDDVLNGYPKLTDEDKQRIKERIDTYGKQESGPQSN